ncbi:MAG: hypothetical protein OEW75_03310 [Cyclobacteriaceae bacterium]|nr:hypothetical protein [Cyclobacteriaceae bacterium]
MDVIIKWSLIIGLIVLVLRFAIAFGRKVASGRPISGVMILTFILTGISAGMATYLIGSIKQTIDERNMIDVREKAITDRLGLIREAEIVYQEVYGKYTSNWDSLINFIEKGQYPIIQRAEEIIPLSYGADSIIVTIDTIGMISAFDRIFKANYSENAVDSGVFIRYYVQPGEKAVKGTKAYAMLNRNGVEFDRNFNNNGTVTEVESINEGDRIVKGQTLIAFWEYKFDPKTNLAELPYVPGYDLDKNVKFDIFTSKIPMGAAQLLVDVIEVKNPKPFNPARLEKNEAKNLKPLRFGSKTDATTSGNWE